MSVVVWGFTEPLDPRRVSAAAALAVPFVVVLAVLAVAAPPTEGQQVEADPLLTPFLGVAPWVTVVAGVAVIATWVRRYPPGRDGLGGDLRAWAVGVAIGLAMPMALFAVVGSELPAFVPPEESARPGLTLGLTAGFLEEVVFRLTVFPAVYFGLRRHGMGDAAASVAAVVASALLFGASHEIGGESFRPELLATRILVPGAAMSAVFRWLRPSFIIGAHCSAHLVMPFLFD